MAVSEGEASKIKSQINKTPGKGGILDSVMSTTHPFEYAQQNTFGLGVVSPNLQQSARSFGGQQFQGLLGRSSSHLPGRITPTSSGMPTFPACLPNALPPQQQSPNSPSMFSLGSVGHLGQRPLSQEVKRMSGLEAQLGGSPQTADDFGKRERSMMFNLGGGPAAGLSGYGLSHVTRSTGGMQNNSFSASPSLDLSEFPSLTNRGAQDSSNPGLSHNPMAGKAPYVGMVKQPTSESNEFHIHSEDFPALPGSQNQDNSQDSVSKQMSHKTSDPSKESLPFLGEETMVQVHKRTGFGSSKGSHVTSVPSGMVADQFGMVGFLSCIRTAETDPKLVSLALGTDLTTLGLNLNISDYLYPSFAGPWAEHPCRPQDIDYFVPSEYLVNQNIRDKLATIKVKQYGDDLLFFLFYMFCGDIMQMVAAVELYNRNWRFHKDEKVWITKVPGVVPSERAATYERSMYYFFDPETWRKVAKEFHLEYDRLEERALAPPSVSVLLTGQARMA